MADFLEDEAVESEDEELSGASSVYAFSVNTYDKERLFWIGMQLKILRLLSRIRKANFFRIEFQCFHFVFF